VPLTVSVTFWAAFLAEPTAELTMSDMLSV
jgi:hypothetical protein